MNILWKMHPFGLLNNVESVSCIESQMRFIKKICFFNSSIPRNWMCSSMKPKRDQKTLKQFLYYLYSRINIMLISPLMWYRWYQSKLNFRSWTNYYLRLIDSCLSHFCPKTNRRAFIKSETDSFKYSIKLINE